MKHNRVVAHAIKQFDDFLKSKLANDLILPVVRYATHPTLVDPDSYRVDNKVRLYHLFDKNLNSGGITIAYRVTDTSTEFAVAICSHKDRYSRKYGASVAVSRFASGELYRLTDNGTPLTVVLQQYRALIQY